MTVVSVKNYRGIARADVTLARTVTLVCGPNAAGKTSFCQAAGAAMCGRMIPVDGLQKSQLTMLVRSGTAAGEVSVDNQIGNIMLSFPSGQRTTTGAHVDISETAAGFESLLDHKRTERTAIVSKLINALPSSADFEAELQHRNIGLQPGEAESIRRTVDSLGWDAAWEDRKQHGARLKGRWEAVTHASYGSAKAQSWAPAAWTADLGSATLQELQNCLASERDWLDAAKAEAAVSAEILTRLEEEASVLPHLQERRKITAEELKGLSETGTKLRATLADLPKASRPEPLACPHCQGSLEIVHGTTLRIPVEITDAELEARAAALTECQRQLDDTVAKYRACNNVLGELNVKCSAAEAAEKNLAARRAKKPVEAGSAEHGGIADCQARVAAAEARLAAWQAKHEADALAAQIAANQEAVEILAPGGLRASHLQARLADFNARLRSICQSAGWRPVELGRDMAISYGGTPSVLCSQSEQYRVRAALQIAIAQIDGSTVLVLDGADVLDAEGRRGLMLALAKCGRQSIVGMTIEKLPRLDQIGGTVVWIVNGEAS